MGSCNFDGLSFVDHWPVRGGRFPKSFRASQSNQGGLSGGRQRIVCAEGKDR